jgi:hypothetical protein
MIINKNQLCKSLRRFLDFFYINLHLITSNVVYIAMTKTVFYLQKKPYL